jgi:Calcineurin-like phosphoesterase
VSLDWDDSTEPDVDRYAVLRSNLTGGPYAVIGNTTSSSHVDASVTSGTTYHYVVEAVDGAGNHSDPSSEVSATPTDLPPPPPSQTVVYALGDAADGSAASGALADYVKAQNPDRFFYLGDVYETGTAAEFASNYEPLYGPWADRTDPVIGNHEYANRSTGYYAYWQAKRGWSLEQAKHRSYVDASGWQVIAYSSETDMIGEGDWVAGEVAKHGGTCRIVMAHKGRHVVTDAAHDDNTGQEPVWLRILGKTAINLVAHNHIYGRPSPIDGVNVLVSGAGGHNLRSLGTQHHPVDASKTGVPTATKLVLRPGAADFEQVDKDGNVYDSGTIGCTPAA